MYLVYKHTTPSGKVYIGITKRTAQARWRSGWGYQSSPHFWSAIQKYGWSNIKHEVLHEGLTKEQACEYEKRYIEEYNATDSRFGYNQKSGGETGTVWNEEIRKKMSEKMKNLYRLHPEKCKEISERKAGKHFTDEHRKNLGEARRGRHHTDESKKKISEANKQRLLDDEALYQARIQQLEKLREKRTCKVEQIDADGSVVAVYESIQATGRITGIAAGSICRVCQGKAKTAGGYGWRYAISDNSGREAAI